MIVRAFWVNQGVESIWPWKKEAPMISEIRPKSHQQYTSLPILGPILDEFTDWSHQHGYSILTVRNQLKCARWIDDFFFKHSVRHFSDITHRDFDDAWEHFRSIRPAIAGTVRQIEKFTEETRGLEPPLPKPKTPADSELDRFSDYLRNVRGLQEVTIQAHRRYLKSFLEHISYDEDMGAMVRLTSKEIEGFLVGCSSRLNRYSLQSVVGYLRAFLRFQHEQGVINAPLHTTIDTPRVYRQEKLPLSLPWETVKALLSSIDRTNAHGVRDYTMLFLIATYGLRPCEVVSLTLDDIDWRAETIKITQRKTGNRLILPLTDAVGHVLVEYLKKGRARVPCRELFLRLRAPHGPLTRVSVYHIFRLRVRLSGLDIPHRGPYCLRHSYAVHLLRQGTSLKTIGDLMGHRSAESTGAYLRLSIEDLRSIALPVPEGPGVDTPLEIVICNRRSNTGAGKKGAKPRAGPPGPLRSFLAGDIEDFINLKRSLGRNYEIEAYVLRYFDAFLKDRYPLTENLGAEMISEWCKTLHHLAPSSRHKHMRVVRNFCLYLRRSRHESFVPDESTFAVEHKSFRPYIFSEPDIARILSATRFLLPRTRSPLRAQTIRIAILLLYTTGIRRGELLRLRLGNFNSAEATLLIQDTKFHKSRITPLSGSVAGEIEAFLALRRKNQLPMEIEAPLIWNRFGGPEGGSYTGTALGQNFRALCSALDIFTHEGKTPRIHDLRHSFAVNVLKSCYQAGEDVGAKLPLLSTYMGHVSIASTHYYLTFIEEIGEEASNRFHQSFGMAITFDHPDKEKV